MASGSKKAARSPRKKGTKATTKPKGLLAAKGHDDYEKKEEARMAGLASAALDEVKKDNEGKLHPHDIPPLSDVESILRGGRSDVSWEQCRSILNENTELRAISLALCDDDEGIFDADHDDNSYFWLNKAVAHVLYTIHKFQEENTKSPTFAQASSNASDLYSAPEMYRTECRFDNDEFSVLIGMMISDEEMNYLHGGKREEDEDDFNFTACPSRKLVDLSGGRKIPTYEECVIIDESDPDSSLDHQKTLIPLFIENDSYYKDHQGHFSRRLEFFIGNFYNFLDKRLTDDQHKTTKKINMGKNQVFVLMTTLSTYRLFLAKIKGIYQHTDNSKENEGIPTLIMDIIGLVNKVISVLFRRCKEVYDLTKKLENSFIKEWEDKEDSNIHDPLPMLTINPPNWKGEEVFLRLFGKGVAHRLLGDPKRGPKTGRVMCHMLWDGVRHEDLFGFPRKSSQANQSGTANATSDKATEGNSQGDESNDKPPYVPVPRKVKCASASEGNKQQAPSKTNELTQEKKSNSGPTDEGKNSTSTKDKTTMSTEEDKHHAPSSTKQTVQKKRKADDSEKKPKAKKTKKVDTATTTKNSSASATALDLAKVTDSIVNMLLDRGVTTQTLTNVKKNLTPLTNLLLKKSLPNLRKTEPHVASMLESIDSHIAVVTNIVSTKEMKESSKNYVDTELDKLIRSFTAKKKAIGKKQNFVPGMP